MGLNPYALRVQFSTFAGEDKKGRMKKSLAGLAELVGSDTAVYLNRKPVDAFSLDGFVVGVSKKLLCLHVIDGKTLMLNGYAIVRLSNIRSYRTDEASFISRALRLLGRKPVIPDAFDLSGWGPLLSSVHPQYRLVMISTEKDAPGCVFIGKLVEHSARSVVIEAVGVDGHWDGRQEFACKDITMVDLGDGYVNALAAVMANEADVAKSAN